MGPTPESSGAEERSSVQKEDGSKVVFVAVIWVGIAIVVVMLLYASQFPHFPSHSTDDWAKYGEYLGGTVGPIAGFATILILWKTLQIQRKDAKVAAQQAKMQVDAANKQLDVTKLLGFEQTLFSWLALHREILNSIQTSDDYQKGGNLIGLQALDRWFQLGFRDGDVKTDVRRWLLEERWTTPPAGLTIYTGSFERLEELPEEVQQWAQQLIMERWDALYKDATYQLDAYFRVLYRLFKWIDESPPDLLSDEKKWDYAALVRAQLSWIELAYLFFNGATVLGKNFIPYYEKFAMFDNLNIRSDQEILTFFRKRTPYKESAYSSVQARSVSKSSV